MNRLLARLFGLVLAIASLSSICNAGVITLSASDIIQSSYSPDPNEPQNAADVIAYLQGSSEAAYNSITDVGQRLFKWNNGTGEEASDLLSSSYDIVDLISGGGAGGTIRYVSGDILNTEEPAWLVVKAGSAGYKLYDLDSTGSVGVNWDGIMDLVFTNAELFNKNGVLQGISHIELWGGSTSGPDPDPEPAPPATDGQVPEPTTMAIWSLMGLCGIGSARRKRAKK